MPIQGDQIGGVFRKATATAYQTKILTISGTALAITNIGFSWSAGYVALADMAVITAHGNPILVTWDGSTPTANTGMMIAAGSTVTIEGNANVLAIQMIRQASADAVVSITLEKFQ